MIPARLAMKPMLTRAKPPMNPPITEPATTAIRIRSMNVTVVFPR